MESNALKKSTNNSVASNLWVYESIFPKTVLNFPKNFLEFWLDTIKKQDIINLSGYSSKSYASVVLNYS